MRDAEGTIASPFYDHEQELARDREARADDWGADSLFDGRPRRRHGRRGAAAETQPRRHTGARSPRSGAFERRPSAAPPPAAEPWDDEPAVAASPADREDPPMVPDGSTLTLGVEWSDRPKPSEPAGRRTVVVTGRPGATAVVPAARPVPAGRRRPSRRPAERLGARPDRVAGWAFALGMLLILVAVGTADAAPLH